MVDRVFELEVCTLHAVNTPPKYFLITRAFYAYFAAELHFTLYHHVADRIVDAEIIVGLVRFDTYVTAMLILFDLMVKVRLLPLLEISLLIFL